MELKVSFVGPAATITADASNYRRRGLKKRPNLDVLLSKIIA